MTPVLLTTVPAVAQRPTEDDPRPVFGANLRHVRTQAQLSQGARGLATRLRPTEINRLERGRRNSVLLTIVRLAPGLEIPAAALLRDL